MKPRIVSVTIAPMRVSPAEAALNITVQLDPTCDGVELRGRLLGPRCPGVTTIEVAYPLRLSRDNPLTLIGVIPEPNFWSPETPYRYDGVLELWLVGTKLDSRTFAVEIRASESCNPV